VSAAARAAAAAVLVGGGLFAEDARPREGGGSRGLVVGGFFACCEQVHGIFSNAFSVMYPPAPSLCSIAVRSAVSLLNVQSKLEL